MSDLVLRAETEMAATPEEVWEGLTNPELTRRYYFGLTVDSDWMPGSPYAFRDPAGQPVEDGTIMEIDSPGLLRLTSRYLFFPPGRDDPPHRVTWEIVPIGQDRSRVRLTMDEFPERTASYQLAAGGIDNILAGLRTVADRELVARLTRVDQIGHLEIKELTPELADDFFAFFDTDAFADNPGWSSCYCMAKHVKSDEWAMRSGDQNRRDQGVRIRHGTARGLLAYVDGRTAGWCNAGPRTSMIGLDGHPDFRTENADEVGAIVCFVIASRFRRHGIASRLLNAACDSLSRQGFRLVEAYPAKGGGFDGSLYRGPLEMYLEEGFTIFRDIARMSVVRRTLNQA